MQLSPFMTLEAALDLCELPILDGVCAVVLDLWLPILEVVCAVGLVLLLVTALDLWLPMRDPASDPACGDDIRWPPTREGDAWDASVICIVAAWESIAAPSLARSGDVE